MKTVTASLVMELNVTCPSCEESFDLFRSPLNDEGLMYEKALADERWKIDASERIEEDVVCPDCGAEFKVKGINW